MNAFHIGVALWGWNERFEKIEKNYWKLFRKSSISNKIKFKTLFNTTPKRITDKFKKKIKNQNTMQIIFDNSLKNSLSFNEIWKTKKQCQSKVQKKLKNVKTIIFFQKK